MCLFLGLSMAELSRRLAGCSKTPICCVSLILPRVKHGAGLLRRTSKYVSLLGISGALHLGIFEQPGGNHFFSNLSGFSLSGFSQSVKRGETLVQDKGYKLIDHYNCRTKGRPLRLNGKSAAAFLTWLQAEDSSFAVSIISSAMFLPRIREVNRGVCIRFCFGFF